MSFCFCNYDECSQFFRSPYVAPIYLEGKVAGLNRFGFALCVVIFKENKRRGEVLGPETMSSDRIHFVFVVSLHGRHIVRAPIYRSRSLYWCDMV